MFPESPVLSKRFGESYVDKVSGMSEPKGAVSADDLSGFLRNAGVECVVLNACYSNLCADSILTNASSVIGMQTEIEDEAAICFSTGFYMAIFQERPIRDAYEYARALVQAEHPNQSDYIIFRQAN